MLKALWRTRQNRFLILCATILFLVNYAIRMKKDYLPEEKTPSLVQDSIAKEKTLGLSGVSLNEPPSALKPNKTLTWWEKLFCKYKIQDNAEGTFKLPLFFHSVHPIKEESENVFVLENNCGSVLTFRTLCCIESLARLNPSKTVFLLAISQIFEPISGNYLRSLVHDVPNISPAAVDLDDLFNNTPIEDFEHTIKFTTIPDFIFPHLSDLMRMSLLYKTGGYYVDADTIGLRVLPPMQSLYLFRPGMSKLASNFFITPKNSEAMLNSLKHVSKHYKGNQFHANGPMAMHYGVMRARREENLRIGTYRNITIETSALNQPVTAPKLKKRVFSPDFEGPFEKVLHDSILMHTNHDANKGESLFQLGDRCLFDQLAQVKCPTTYNEFKKNPESVVN